MTLKALIERGNAVIATNKLELQVTQLQEGIQCNLNERSRNPAEIVGLTVSREWHDCGVWVLIFSDGTYTAFEIVHEYEEPPQLVTASLDCEDGIKAGLVSDDAVKQLREAEQARQEPLEDERAKRQLLKASASLGPDKAKAIIQEAHPEQ